jgi:hypothetical protein
MNKETIIFILVIWYIIGVIGGFIVARWSNKYNKCIDWYDVIMAFTLCGVLGLVTLIAALGYYHDNCPNNFLKKRIF